MKRGTVVDYKKREQWLAGRLPAPDDNDQLHAYAIGAGLTHYRLCLLLFGDGAVEAVWSGHYTPENTGPVLDRIKRTCAPPADEPRGTSGEHCGQCYPRIHCPHWALRGHKGIVDPTPATIEGAADLYLETKAMEEQARRNRQVLRDLAEDHDGFRVGAQEYRRVISAGSLLIDRDALERDGLVERYSYLSRGSVRYQPCKPRAT